MDIKKTFILLILFSFLTSCQALQGQKRSDTSDEFLVEKKNPLVLPPDYDKMPVPVDQENLETSEDEDSENLKKLLQKKRKNNNNSEGSSLEETILEKINE